MLYPLIHAIDFGSLTDNLLTAQDQKNLLQWTNGLRQQIGVSSVPWMLEIEKAQLQCSKSGILQNCDQYVGVYGNNDEYTGTIIKPDQIVRIKNLFFGMANGLCRNTQTKSFQALIHPNTKGISFFVLPDGSYVFSALLNGPATVQNVNAPGDPNTYCSGDGINREVWLGKYGNGAVPSLDVSIPQKSTTTPSTPTTPVPTPSTSVPTPSVPTPSSMPSATPSVTPSPTQIPISFPTPSPTQSSDKFNQQSTPHTSESYSTSLIIGISAASLIFSSFMLYLFYRWIKSRNQKSMYSIKAYDEYPRTFSTLHNMGQTPQDMYKASTNYWGSMIPPSLCQPVSLISTNTTIQENESAVFQSEVFHF
eukprot:NODE_795_length_3846_cov_0.843074.p1 type:complete len:364 gc:universal NODE_795_length_3846_cov_0.843074:1678-2769(+)